MNQKEIVLFESADKSVSLRVPFENETVWLSSNQMAILFERDEKTIRKHVNNVFEEHEVESQNNTHFLRVADVKQPVKFYSLDVIISVGYRVKSNRGIEFRRWANSVLKQYILNGYAVNERKKFGNAVSEKIKNMLFFYPQFPLTKLEIRCILMIYY